jgi:hypothetical protein
MDLENAYSYIESESNNELLVYVAIGCSLDLYKPGEHPPQQYPPYLKEFKCPQICVLIDPRLELPPRALADTADSDADVTFLAVQQAFNYTSRYGESTAWFLDKIVQLCATKRVKLIAQDFTGSDINNYYPFTHGHQILKKVLYDPTYGNSGCYVDFSTIEIFREAHGDFLQPKYLPFRMLKTLAPHLLKEQLSARLYPVVHLLHRLYRILHNKEEVRDWCTIDVVRPHLEYTSFTYKVQIGSFEQCLYQTLLESTRDILSLTDSSVKEELVVDIVGSAGKEMENLWNRVKLAL